MNIKYRRRRRIRRIRRRIHIFYFRDDTDQTNLQSNEVITMRTNTNEINVHLLLSNDINCLREAGQ